MKKLLTILGAVGLTATTGATVVACGPTDKTEKFAFLEDTNASVIATFKAYTDQKVDVKGLTYEEFFHMSDKEGNTNYNFLQVNLYDKVSEALKAITKGGTGDDKDQPKYTEEQVNAEVQKVLKWSQAAISLVYVDFKDYTVEKPKQEVISTITKNSAKTDNLETVFVNAVKSHYGDKFENTSEWWQDHNKASLALHVNLNQGDVKLAEGTPELLTFTFG